MLIDKKYHTMHVLFLWKVHAGQFNNNNNITFILHKIRVNMIKCALHESKLSTLISYPK